MTKLYTFIQKIIKLKRKLSAKLGYNRTNFIYAKKETNQEKKMFQLRSKERSMEQLQKKYRVRSLAPRRYEKWI